jgi:hypothetical protein
MFSGKSREGNQNIHSILNFSKIRAVYGVEVRGRAGQATDGIIRHVRCAC